MSEENKKELGLEKNEFFLYSPGVGTVISLKAVKDEAFSSETLGKGLALIPLKGVIKAPCSGRVFGIPETKHALGISTENGGDILIHIGMNTVKLNGKYFYSEIKEGQKVKKGDELIRFDLEKITELGYDITTPVIISNAEKWHKIKTLVPEGSKVSFGEKLIFASKK